MGNSLSNLTASTNPQPRPIGSDSTNPIGSDSTKPQETTGTMPTGSTSNLGQTQWCAACTPPTTTK